MKRRLQFKACVKAYPSTLTITIEGKSTNVQKAKTKIRQSLKNIGWTEI